MTMNKEILMVVDAVSNEKGVDKDIIFEAIEAALASATRKRTAKISKSALRSIVKPGTTRRSGAGSYSKTTRPRLETPDRELPAGRRARRRPENAEPGGYVEEPMESIAFGRIAAQTAKQVIVQKVREAERAQVVEEYESRAGELVNGSSSASTATACLSRSRRQCRGLRARERT